MPEPIYSTKLIAGSKTYFFNVRETKTKDKYLQISETRLQEGGERLRNNIAIFKDHFAEFRKFLDEAADKL